MNAPIRDSSTRRTMLQRCPFRAFSLCLFFYFLFISTILVSYFTVSQAAAQTLDSVTIKKIDSLFKKRNSNTGPGCVVGIVRNDSLIYTKGYGMANVEYQIPITTKTIFEMASVSKQFTAFAIMLLAQQGKLKFDDDIHKYLPWVPDFGKKITIANLLYHTSGIRDYDQLLEIAGTTQEDVITREHVIKILSKQRTLNFDPGEQYLYSNSGYFLAGEIVHSVTGKTLRQFTDSAVFKPLGMNNTHFRDDYAEVVNNRAYPYWEVTKISIANSSAVGAKGLLTNVDDMSKWAIAFCDSKSAFYPIMQQMIRSGKLNTGKETGVGTGIEMTDFEGFKMYFHYGSIGACQNFVEYLPGAKMALMFFSNGGSYNLYEVSHELPRLFIKGQPQGKTAAAIKLRGDSIITDTVSAKQLAGSYITDDGVQTEFKIKNQKFYAVYWGTNFLLLRTARDSFYIPGTTGVDISNQMNFAFTRKSNGTITVKKTWTGNNTSQKMIRIDAKNKLALKELLTYTGKYYCRELDCSYAIVLKDKQLKLTNAKYNDSPITFYDKNRLFNDLDCMHTLLITRDKKGKIIGFEVNYDTIQDLRFDKVQ